MFMKEQTMKKVDRGGPNQRNSKNLTIESSNKVFQDAVQYVKFQVFDGLMEPTLPNVS